MTPAVPRPAAVLRHRGPALLIAAAEAIGDGALRCTGRDDGPWPWPRALEAAAQAAGLVAGLEPGGPRADAVIAEYRDVAVHVAEHRGALSVTACVERRVLRFWRCRVEARASDGTVLLAGTVTIAPGP
jgi:predicted hotdog family 3-hydroxylacyl-ACP dehydratase